MENFLLIVGLLVIIEFVIKNAFKDSVNLLRITHMREDFIPQILLEFAGIQKKSEAKFDDLTKEEQKKLIVAWNKAEKSINCNLTFFSSHNIIHVQKHDKSYFYKVSDTDRYVIYEKVGDLPNKKELYFVLYRKSNGWPQGATLIGYFIKKEWMGTEEKVTLLFKFPEAIIKRRFFTKGLQKQFYLKEDVMADYIDKDELGYSRGLYGVGYETDNKNAPGFRFQID